MNTQAIPHLNLVYEDERGQVYTHIHNGRLYLHSILYEPDKLSSIKLYRDFLKVFEEELLKRGITTYYTMADSLTNFKMCELMGFETIYEVLDGKFEIMKKELA